MRPRASVLVWPVLAHAAAWAAFLWLALWPASYRGTRIEMDSVGTYTTTSQTASLVAVNGPWVLLPLFVPVALTGLALLAVLRWGPGRWVLGAFLWLLALLSLGFCVLGMLSIGVFYLPAALALVVTAVVCTFRTHGRGGGREWSDGVIMITVNGQIRELEGPMTLPRFIEGLGVRAAFLAVAYNGEVLRREEHASVTLKEGDVLELVRPVGGGAAGGGAT